MLRSALALRSGLSSQSLSEKTYRIRFTDSQREIKLKRYMIRYLILVLLPFIWFTAESQITLNGRVVNASGKPLPQAKIQALYLPLEAYTNSYGVFELGGLPSGHVEIKVTCPGYAFVTLKVNLKNAINTLTIKLEEELLPVLSPLYEELNHYREKVFVVTDKPYYYPGEVIWLKAFLNYADLSKRDSLSRVVYVELLDFNSQRKIRQVLSLDSGRLAGSILLPDELPAGNYVMRAYTRFMYNFGEDQFFYKSIPVLNNSARAFAFSESQLPQTNFDEVKTMREAYGLRQQVDITFPNLPEGTYTLSVTDMNQVAAIPELELSKSWAFEPGILKTPPVGIDQIVEKGVRFTGKFVSEFKTGKQVTLSLFKQDMSEVLEFVTDEKGWFQVNGLKFYDSVTFFYKATRGKKSNDFYGRIEIATEKEPAPDLVVPGFWFKTETATNPQRMLADYLAPPEVKMLQEVEVRASRIESSQYKGIRGGADKIVKAENLLNFGNLLLSLQGKIPGLTINCNTSPCEVRFSRAAAGSINSSTEPLVLINDTPVGGSAGTILQNLDINMVERIEVSRRMNVLYGDQGRNGIIAVYLKEGFTRFSKPEEATPSFELMGFNKPFTFISPDYANANQDNSVSDYRSTLYWNPELKKNADAYRCSFFTADIPGRYRIRLQGITHQNQPVYLETTLTVTN
ncbi:MAG: carboxypeptidase regulatory-like domain-containing protein [Cyclobacteriaceae bacterium]|nr:carboxypeptidase regulatory-like domain-containing protein [Cyclobacteriaceae bacterium]